MLSRRSDWGPVDRELGLSAFLGGKLFCMENRGFLSRVCTALMDHGPEKMGAAVLIGGFWD